MAEGRADPAPPGSAPGGPGPGEPGPGDRRSAGYELLEHTADVGIRATGPTLEAAFEQATRGLAEVLGALAPEGSGGPPGWAPGGPAGPGEVVAVEVSADDPGGLLVDWLNEVLWLREERQARMAGVRVERVGDGAAAGWVAFSGDDPPPDGTFVKAATYHRLRVEPDPGGGWLIEVYLDV
jgi:SHS2 domain-containing protein